MDYEFQFKYGRWSYYTRTTNLTKYWVRTLNNERVFEVITEEFFNKQQLKALKKEAKQ